MKLSTLCLALLTMTSVVPAAHAQSSVQIYGLLDVGYEYASNAEADGRAALRQVTHGKNTSRWGFRGTENLASGVSAIWNLEGGVSLDTGANSSDLFRRHAWVGLDHQYGRIVFGRSFTTVYDFLVPFDPMGYAAKYSWVVNTNASAAARYGMTPAFDNLVKYSGAYGPFKFGATLGLGEQEGSSADGRKLALGGSWTHNGLAFMLAYENINGNSLAATGRRDATRALYLGVDYRSGPWRFTSGMRDYQLSLGRAPAEIGARTYWGGVNYQLRPTVTLTGALYAVDVDTAPVGGQADPVLYVARVVKGLSKRTDIYLSAAYAKADNLQLVSLSRVEAGYGSTQAGLSIGLQHRF
jgi:predicted porin